MLIKTKATGRCRLTQLLDHERRVENQVKEVMIAILKTQTLS